MKIYLLSIITLIIFNGCATWNGLKQDSSDAWNITKDTSSEVYDSTKKAINKATSD